MKGAIVLALLTITLAVVIDALPFRKANIRYVNSMPQFGKAKLSAYSPQTLMFDQVPQGSITDYSNIDAQSWNFTTLYTTNATANSDEVNIDGDSFVTVFTCQASQRRLKNKVVVDVGRSVRPNFALLRAINLAQYNYDVDVFNGTATLFNNVPYCSASSYIQVPPGDYVFDWTVSDDKKRGIESCPPNCSGPRGLSAGKAYTLFITPAGTYAVQDAKKNFLRNVQSDATSQAAETSPITEERTEKVDVTAEVKEEKGNNNNNNNNNSVRRKRAIRKAQRAEVHRNSS